MQIKTFSATVSPRPTSEGKFKALVAVFGVVDRGGDVVHKGAFTASFARSRAERRNPPVLDNHLYRDAGDIIGHISSFDSQETDLGLIVSGTLHIHKERGATVYEELKRGTISQWSFGCVIEESRPRAGGGRDLIRLDLFEVSPTLLGKGIGTQTLMVASAPVVPQATMTPTELLAPWRARLDVAQRRVSRSREQ